jgi:hypothetical protein
MKLDNKQIEAGSYTMYAIPRNDQITIIINSATHVWGAYSYDKKMDVIRVTVPLRQVSQYLEAFSMTFQKSNEGIDLHFGWGNYRGTLPFSK